jgi:hypothetical protein
MRIARAIFFCSRFGGSEAFVWPLGRTAGPSTALPRIPVEVGGVGGLHAVFLGEDRTRGSVVGNVTGIRVRFGPTASRGRRDDKFVWAWEFSESKPSTQNKFVIPPAPACRGTGAQRSGGICGAPFPQTKAPQARKSRPSILFIRTEAQRNGGTCCLHRLQTNPEANHDRPGFFFSYAP